MQKLIEDVFGVIAASCIMTNACWAASGHVGKWDDRKPDVSYLATGNMFDMERCLMRTKIGGMIVYAQPDRPNERLIIWLSGADSGDSNARVDLSAEGDKVKVTMWQAPDKDRKGVRRCFPDMPEESE